ncbi:MAG TPA: glycosyltransferase family 2 protein [Bryobacteraceae bacterium]|nr:glycosyltransferase family 2 protein [Bryobacteraceae bacterium]
MADLRATIIIPTLAAGEELRACLDSLLRQSFDAFNVIIVDNSGRGAARHVATADPRVTLIESPHNLGFGAAINLGAKRTSARYIATLNDDAVAGEHWIERLVEALDYTPAAGMAASRVLLAGTHTLDSAGMLLCADGSSKQRGHRAPETAFVQQEEVLCPSGSAALYRRELFDTLGGFDEKFFLYCEDSDLGLRARWAGWSCVYVPEARVDHRYSHSAGRVSPLKAYLVERNRLRLVVKTFPARMLWRVPFAALARYWAHLVSIQSGSGAAAEFTRTGAGSLSLAWFVVKAHLALLAALPDLLAKRSHTRRNARISSTQFAAIAKRFVISPEQVAAQ